jgi:hypothetical protein
MRPTPPHPAPDERGFILVGVVTFMLALTILGLSLFALSSYEAQFFVVSAAREQSLQDSESGMELVKALLAAPGSRLEAAHLAEGQMGVTHALAYQWRSGLSTDTTSAGLVNWDSTLVVVVSAKSGGAERTLQAKYIPTATESPYHKLLAAGTGVSVNTENTSSASVLQLSGRVWQPVASDADTAWTADANWKSGRPIELGAPPMPLADDFVDQNLPGSKVVSTVNLDNKDDYELKFDAQGSSPNYYHSPPSPTDAEEDEDDPYDKYTFYTGANLSIKVSGIAVWVVPQGICFKDQVSVSLDGGGSGTLIIVAKASNDPGNGNRAIWFKGGLTMASGTSIYLVSQGDISLVHSNDNNNSNNAQAVSIVAGGRIEIGGPESGDVFRLGYDPALEALGDQLLSQGALPPVTGGSGASFVVVRPSWSETTPR